MPGTQGDEETRQGCLFAALRAHQSGSQQPYVSSNLKCVRNKKFILRELDPLKHVHSTSVKILQDIIVQVDQ